MITQGELNALNLALKDHALAGVNGLKASFYNDILYFHKQKEDFKRRICLYLFSLQAQDTCISVDFVLDEELMNFQRSDFLKRNLGVLVDLYIKNLTILNPLKKAESLFEYL